jgi:hypothetical protein
MNRYAAADIVKDIKGRRKIQSIILPVIPLSDSDTFILTTSIERLDKLAYSAYGDESYWWVLASCNGLGKGSILVPTNTRLRIPSKQGLEEYIRIINTER